MERRILPNFFIVGAAKAGTTSLHHYLKQHPKIFMSPLKEPHYFANLSNCRRKIRVVNDWEEYISLFRGAKDHIAVGESSVSYLCHKGAARNIIQTIPNAKIIVILRNPIDRIFSHYLMDMREGKVDPDLSFKDLIMKDYLAQKEKKWCEKSMFVECGMYCSQVKEYLDTFGKKNLMILFYEDMIENSYSFFAEMFHFLGVDMNFQPDQGRKYNTFSVPRNPFFKIVYTSSTVRNIGRRILPEKRKAIVEKLLLRKSDKPSLSRDDRNFLKELYMDDIMELQDVIERDLSTWCR